MRDTGLRALLRVACRCHPAAAGAREGSRSRARPAPV
jgi:hypothetical protein